MINSPHPLARRIVAGFVLITTVVSGAFSASIVSIVLMVEQHLVSKDLDHTISTVLQDIQNGQVPKLGSDTRFYASNLPAFKAPDELNRLDEGFSEFIDNGDAFYVFTKEINGNRYQVVQDQTEFETRERVIYSVVVGGFLLSIALAWVLGTLIARRVMLPVTRLALAVNEHRKKLAEAPALSPDYPPDEVGDLARAIDATIAELRGALDRERLFTSDISHELRTPLMIISSSCELLAAQLNEERPQAHVRRIAEAVREMQGLVETLMLLAREKSSDARTVPRSTLEEVAKEVMARRQPEIQAKGLAFEFTSTSASSSLYPVTALRTVLDNLIRNAIHYTERGTIRMVLSESGLTIEDSGIGIPADEHLAIFGTFARGTQARGEGLGLGLSLVRRICASENWSIRIESVETGGTKFSVLLSGSFGANLS